MILHDFPWFSQFSRVPGCKLPFGRAWFVLPFSMLRDFPWVLLSPPVFLVVRPLLAAVGAQGSNRLFDIVLFFRQFLRFPGGKFCRRRSVRAVRMVFST